MNFWPRSVASFLVPLKHACALNPESLPETTDSEYEIEYVDIGSVSLERGIESRETLRFAEAPSRARKPIRNGDVIIATVRTYLRAIALVDNASNNWIASTGFSVCRPHQPVDPGYLYRAIQSGPFVESVVACSTGVSYPAINPSTLGGLLVPIPDLPTQQAIAAFLDRETARIDQLIAKKERMVLLISEERGAAVSVAVTRGFGSGCQLKETGSPYLPYTPSSWSLQRLKQLAVVRGGITLGRTLPAGVPVQEVPYLRVANVQAGHIDLDTITMLDATQQEIRRYSLRQNDVLMNEGGDNDKLGRGAVWDGTIKVCLHQNHVFAVRPHDPYLAQWISLASNSRYGRDFFYLNSKQSTNLASISKSKLEQFPVALPPTDERHQILRLVEDRLKRCDALTRSIVSTVDRLRELQSAVITAAVTGQIDVATWGRRGETDRRLDAIELELATEQAGVAG